MVPVAPGTPSGKAWDSNTTINLITLILAVPGAITALATIWFLRKGLQSEMRGQ